MEVEKIRNLSDDELALEGRKAAEALFRLRFQMKLGQTEGVKKLRELKKDVARINTISRERAGEACAPESCEAGEEEDGEEGSGSEGWRQDSNGQEIDGETVGDQEEGVTLLERKEGLRR